MYHVDELDDDETPQARPWYKVVSEFRQWYAGYLNSHMEFVNEEGETARTALENSYMPSYGDRYYAKLMDLKRGVSRQWSGDMQAVMLTFSASTLNANDDPRAPADHMREIADGWDTARKQLHQVLSGYNWEYAKVWEPTTEDGHGPAGYGHMHVAVFVEVEDRCVRPESAFRPVMRSYVANTPSAGWEAHRPDGDGAVSLFKDGGEANIATYISEYIGSYGKETLNRSMHEQAFLAVSWATKTRRVEFSEGAQQLISREHFRRETGLRPEDRGRATADTEGSESDESDDEGEHMAGVRIDPESETVERVEAESDESDTAGWTADAICQVSSGEPEYHDTSTGGVAAGPVEVRPGVDPPREVGDPPPGPGAGVEVPAVTWSYEMLTGVLNE
jgi:hypothetical protein